MDHPGRAFLRKRKAANMGLRPRGAVGWTIEHADQEADRQLAELGYRQSSYEPQCAGRGH
jgi:hypothetical protein